MNNKQEETEGPKEAKGQLAAAGRAMSEMGKKASEAGRILSGNVGKLSE